MHHQYGISSFVSQTSLRGWKFALFFNVGLLWFIIFCWESKVSEHFHLSRVNVDLMPVVVYENNHLNRLVKIICYIFNRTRRDCGRKDYCCKEKHRPLADFNSAQLKVRKIKEPITWFAVLQACTVLTKRRKLFIVPRGHCTLLGK